MEGQWPALSLSPLRELFLSVSLLTSYILTVTFWALFTIRGSTVWPQKVWRVRWRVLRQGQGCTHPCPLNRQELWLRELNMGVVHGLAEPLKVVATSGKKVVYVPEERSK